MLFRVSLSVIRDCELLIATRKAVSFKDTLEEYVVAWGTTEPVIVGRIKTGASPLRKGDELTIFETY